MHHFHNYRLYDIVCFFDEGYLSRNDCRLQRHVLFSATAMRMRGIPDGVGVASSHAKPKEPVEQRQNEFGGDQVQ